MLEKNMTLTQLRYVLAVHDTGSFALAAKKCSVTQPTLSMQIKKLEDSLKAQLFDRSKLPIQTTQMGKEIIEHARNMMSVAKKIENLTAKKSESLSGKLKLAVIPTLSSSLIPLFLPFLIKKYPDLEIFIEDLKTEEIIEQLNQEKIDLGILATPLHESSLEEFPLFTEPFVAYFPELHPLLEKSSISPKDLRGDDILLLQEGHCFRSQTIDLCHVKNPNRLKLQAGNLETLIRLVDKNMGYTLLPFLSLMDLTKSKLARVRYFSEPVPSREVSIVIKQGFPKTKLLNYLKQDLQSIFLPKLEEVKDLRTKVLEIDR